MGLGFRSLHKSFSTLPKPIFWN